MGCLDVEEIVEPWADIADFVYEYIGCQTYKYLLTHTADRDTHVDQPTSLYTNIYWQR